MRYFFTITLALLAFQPGAQAQWTPANVQQLMDDVADIWNQTSGLKTRTINIKSDTGSILSNTGTLLTDTGTVLGQVDGLQNILSIVTDSSDLLSEEMLGAIADELADLQDGLEEELDGLEEFAPGGDCDAGPACVALRDDMATLIGTVGSLVSSLASFDLEGSPPDEFEVDLQLLIDAIQAAPGRLLYPIYRVFSTVCAAEGGQGGSTGSAEGCAVDSLGKLISKTNLIDESLQDLKEALQTAATCEFIANHEEEYSLTVNIVMGSAAFLKSLGQILILKGKTRGKDVSIWGWAGFEFQTDPVRKWGRLFDGMSDLTFKVTAATTDKIRYCVIVENQKSLLRAICEGQVPARKTCQAAGFPGFPGPTGAS